MELSDEYELMPAKFQEFIPKSHIFLKELIENCKKGIELNDYKFLPK
jgi:hypothetical protein